MKPLMAPDEQLAQALREKVPYAERFTVYTVSGRGGMMATIAYSFVEVVGLMSVENGFLDPIALSVWVRDSYNDVELSERLETGCKAEPTLFGRMQVVRYLLQQRLAQCNELAVS